MAANLHRVSELPASAGTTIPPVDDSVRRPLISVVLPVHEPSRYLIEALRSVLRQDMGVDVMQIAVVDDASSTCDVAGLIAEAAPQGRIEFHRMTQKLGLGKNWNRCVQVARGQIIHILHQDDWVAPGFYRHMLPAFAASDRVGMAFCRYALTDRNGRITRYSHRERWRAGVLKSWLKAISERQHIQCVSVLVRRNVYEQLGGYRSDLCYALDWEMWVRIAARFSVWYQPRMLAYYRQHDDTESSRLRNIGETDRDVLKTIEVFSDHLPAAQREQLISKAYASFARRTIKRLASIVPESQQDMADRLESVNAAIARITCSPQTARLYRNKSQRLEQKWQTAKASRSYDGST